MARLSMPPRNRQIQLLLSPAVQSTVEREIKLAIDDRFPLCPTSPASRFHDGG